jgi:hypothetical protein
MEDYYTSIGRELAIKEREEILEYAKFLSQPGSRDMPLPEKFWPPGTLRQMQEQTERYHNLRSRLGRKCYII